MNAGKPLRAGAKAAPGPLALTRARLPEPFASWFAARGWAPHAHQLALLEAGQAGRDTLLIAPTGGGKTLAGFLPSLVDLAARSRLKPGAQPGGTHTLYVSPLKALATDIARNLATPVEEMALPIRLETRTGDTPASRRARQRVLPPDILLTTPEQIALMLSHQGAAELFGGLKILILDELHALASSPSAAICSRSIWHGSARTRRASRPSASPPPWRGPRSSPPSSCRMKARWQRGSPRS